MPKYPMYHKAAANLRHFPLTAPLQQHQDVPPLAWMGILTEDAIRNLAQQDVPTVLRMGILTQDEIRNLALHIEHCRSEDQAMESDLMQVQAAVHEVTHARRQNQEAMYKIATDTGRLLQLLSRPEVQQHKRFKHLTGFLPRCQPLHRGGRKHGKPVVERAQQRNARSRRGNGPEGFANAGAGTAD
mmetsp:Transcript_26139/g.50048  ORF Transcript_26139/g.50048 Transcript_26139/m.50048 type:complete len:186 (-) Transcript_26139:124-681(-)